MPDEPSSPNKGGISVGDAIRLKHKINQEIRCSGLNAREIGEMKKISPEQWAALRKSCEEFVRQWRYMLACSCVIAVAWVLVEHYVGEWRWYADLGLLLVMAYLIWVAGKSEGRVGGFLDGFEKGHEAGIDKVLGIDGADRVEIRERSIQMEIDETLIRGLDKKERDGS